MEVLRNLKNALKVAEYFNTDWQKDYNKTFAVGTTIQVKFPQQFVIRDGLGYNPQGIDRISTTVSLDEPFGIDFQWDDYEAAVKAERSEEEIKEQYLEPAGVQIAQEIDSRAAFFAKNNTSQIVGTLGTDPTSVVFLDNARARLLQKAAPPGKRCALISSSMQTNSINTPVTSLFQPSDEITMAFKEGSLGRLKGFDVFEEQSLYTHTAGTWAGRGHRQRRRPERNIARHHLHRRRHVPAGRQGLRRQRQHGQPAYSALAWSADAADLHRHTALDRVRCRERCRRAADPAGNLRAGIAVSEHR